VGATVQVARTHRRHQEVVLFLRETAEFDFVLVEIERAPVGYIESCVPGSHPATGQ